MPDANKARRMKVIVYSGKGIILLKMNEFLSLNSEPFIPMKIIIARNMDCGCFQVKTLHKPHCAHLYRESFMFKGSRWS